MAQDGIGVCDDLLRQIRSGGAPGLDPEVIEKILGEYFCGKRAAVRTCAFVDLKVTGKRGGEEQELKITILKTTRTRVSLEWTEKATPLQAAIRESWLKSMQD